MVPTYPRVGNKTSRPTYLGIQINKRMGGSAANPNGTPAPAQAGPFIRLDTTVNDIYEANGIKGPFIVTMYCVFGHMDLHPSFPRELVYPEDEEPVPYDSNDEKDVDKLRKVILGLKPLRRAFGLGNMDVIFLAPNIEESGMQRALVQLDQQQRHRPRVLDLDEGNVHEQLKQVTKDRKLLYWRPQGWMDEHNCLLDPREMFHLNSKSFLITSGIRTPRSAVIDLRRVVLDEPSCVFRTRSLPFVVKLCRAGCGFGTFLVTSEAQRDKMVASLTAYKARGTAEVILSEYIDLVHDLAVHFVVGAPETLHDRNDPLIVGVTIQTLTADGKWVGGHIDYSMQPALHQHVREIVRDTARKLPRSFVGWAGVDIVEDRQGEQWVVDLNARFTGSMPICLMSHHFWRDRQLPLAQFATMEYSRTADSIYRRLQPLVETGQVVITATAKIEEGLNMADVVWAGKDSANLREVEQWIRQKLCEQ